MLGQTILSDSRPAIQVFLPMSLATQKANERYRKRLAAEQADSAAAIVDKVGEEVVDLFNRDRECFITLSDHSHIVNGRPQRDSSSPHAAAAGEKCGRPPCSS
jgi:hypothetical protein